MEKTIINAEDVRFSYVSAEGVAPIVLDGIDLDTPADVMKALLRHPGMAASGAWTLLRCLI